jgi:hypothetical protein
LAVQNRRETGDVEVEVEVEVEVKRRDVIFPR